MMTSRGKPADRCPQPVMTAKLKRESMIQRKSRLPSNGRIKSLEEAIQMNPKRSEATACFDQKQRLSRNVPDLKLKS
ncbi:hypothetical protein Mapa_013230 [Marchantia paleacea]|nr:hypothetical protein Mapa_013230 [Marchantia paleacea]